jgi:hypothetical protein
MRKLIGVGLVLGIFAFLQGNLIHSNPVLWILMGLVELLLIVLILISDKDSNLKSK